VLAAWHASGNGRHAGGDLLIASSYEAGGFVRVLAGSAEIDITRRADTGRRGAFR